MRGQACHMARSSPTGVHPGQPSSGVTRPTHVRARLVPRFRLGLPPTLLLLAACGAQGVVVSEPPLPPGPPTSVAAAVPRHAPRDVVEDVRSVLSQAFVTRTRDGLHVTTMWSCHEAGCRGRRALATSEDGFVSAHHWRWTLRRHQSVFPDGGGPDVPVLAGLVQREVPSLVPSPAGRWRAVVGGGDGATLLPFEALARSVDGGRSWERFDVPLVEGERAYTTGAVVLPDGRVLALLGHWSGDRAERPSALPHGLWVSGADWATYAALEATFDPPLPAANPWPPLVGLGASTDGDGVVWAHTVDRLYVSLDGARSFREVPAR